MPSQTPCPEPSRLRQLLDNALPEPEQAELNTHLENCETCRSALDRLAAGSESWSDAARQLGVVLGSESQATGAAELDPALQNVVEQLQREMDTNPNRQRGDASGASGPGVGEHSAGGPGAAGPAASDAIPLDFLDPPAKPDRIGRLENYDVVELIGHGGMGIVLKGFDPKLNRFVAIKVLAPQLATTAAARKRFEREAKAAAAVRNEHVINIHAVDEWRGLPYLVMEYISGVSLQQRIDERGPAKVEEVLRIGMQAATGLAAAHAQGLIHRDIKPANILLENGVERVKLTDFGLARAVDDASLTQSGVVAGTPQYMAPEQARGESLDPRADLFSLGSVLYFMCTGRPPFRATETMAVLKRVSEDTPRPIREVNPDVPEWLCEIIEKLHAKDAAARFQSATEVAAILGTHLAQFQHPALVAATFTEARRASEGIAGVARPESANDENVGQASCLSAPSQGIHRLEAYATTAATDQTEPRSDSTDLRVARHLVRGPAIALIVVGFVPIVAAVVIWVSLMVGFRLFESLRNAYGEPNNPFIFGNYFHENHADFRDANAGVIAVFLIYGALVAWGGRQLRRLRAFELVGLSVFLTFLPPFIGTLGWFDEPMFPFVLLLVPGWFAGMWAGAILVKREVREAFRVQLHQRVEENSAAGSPTRPQPRAAQSHRFSVSKLQRALITVILALLAVAFVIPLVMQWRFGRVPGRDVTRERFRFEADEPVVGDEIVQTLDLKPIQVTEMNKLIQAAYRDYQPLVTAHTQVEKDDAGRVHVTIAPFSESLDAIEQRLWAGLDGLLDERQRAVARRHLPVVALLRHGRGEAAIDIWKEKGTWHYKEFDKGRMNGSSGFGKLPEKYKRYVREAIGSSSVRTAHQPDESSVSDAHPTPQPGLLKKFDPAKDKPLRENAVAEEGGWRIDVPVIEPGIMPLFTVDHDLPERGELIYRAKMKSKAGAASTSFTSLLWVSSIVGSRFLDKDTAEWTEMEVRVPLYRLWIQVWQGAPSSVPLNFATFGGGTVWIKDVELWHVPALPAKPPTRRPGESVVQSFNWKDKPITASYANEGPDGGWRFDLEKEQRLIRLFKIEGPSLARRATVPTAPADDPEIEACKLILRARMRTTDIGAAWLEIVYRTPDGTEFTSTKPLAGDIAERSTEWTDFSTTILVMPGVRPDLIRINLQTEGGTVRQHGYHLGGTVWIKDVELLKSELVVPPSGGTSKPEPAEAGTPTPQSAALIDAASTGQASRIKQLLDDGANVNDKNAAGETALMKAAAGGHSSLVKTLVLLGADPNERDKQGRTALIHAAEAGQASVIKGLYEIHAISYDEASTRPAQLKQLSGIDARLLGNADVQVTQVAVDRFAQDNLGETALMKAMAHGHVECVELLLSRVNQDTKEWFLGYGGPIHSQDVQGRTALHHAIGAGKVQSVQRMIRVSHIPGNMNDTGRPALDAKLLAMTDQAGSTPLQLASELGHKEITDLLRQHIDQLIKMNTRLIGGRAALVKLDVGWTPDPSLYAERGRLYEMLGDRERAEADFKEAKLLEAGDPESTPAADADTKPELKWARGVAESYLQVAGSHNADDDRVMTWFSENFKTRFQPSGTDTWVHYRFKKYAIATQQLSPTQDEGIFKGTLEATERRKFERLGLAWRETAEEFQGTVRFTIRVVKDKETGRWRVDQVQYEVPPHEGGNEGTEH